MNYIETSYLRGTSFEKLQLIPNKKLSYKLFFELLSGIDSKEQFEKRKKQIIKAKKLDAYIDWRSTIAVVYNSFSINALVDKEKTAIKGIIDYIDEKTQYEDVDDIILLKKFGTNLPILVNEDKQKVMELLEKSRVFTIKERETYGFNLRTFKINEDNPEIYSAVELGCKSFTLELSRQIEAIPEIRKKINRSDLIKFYNGDLDVFARCSSMYNHNIIMAGNFLAKNDGDDFRHLLYIKSGDIVYSKDHIFKKFEEYGYIKVVSE